MTNTGIQWCDDTVNPVAGCDGCELFTGIGAMREALISGLAPVVASRT